MKTIGDFLVATYPGRQWSLPNGGGVVDIEWLDGTAPDDIDAKLAAYDLDAKPPKVQFSVRDFAKRFTLAERIAIRQASMTDMEVGLVYDDFNRAQFIDVTDPEVAMGLDLYTSKGLIGPERKAELLTPEAAE